MKGFELPTIDDIKEDGLDGFILMGLLGKAGCGKSKVAKHIKKNYNAVWLDFATPIRDMLDAFDQSRNRPNSSRKLKVNSKWLTQQEYKMRALGVYGLTADDVTYRTLMQKLGTEFGRNAIHENLWIRKLYDTINFGVDPRETQLLIIDGVRFENEVEFIKRFPMHFFMEVFRESNGAELSETEAAHSSEAGIPRGAGILDSVVVIDNSENLAYTFNQVSDVMENWGIGIRS